MRMPKLQPVSVRLTAEGKYWGTLRIVAGRLLLDCQRHGRQVQFDLLASVESGRPAVVGEVVRMLETRAAGEFELD